jgi:AcrR family transcriptional regulator
MPTGVALTNARTVLFDAAARVLQREGPGGLTSRAVTIEAGVAKGVMHRYFADFDAFLAELILDRVTELDGATRPLREAAGTASVADGLVELLTVVFSPLAVAIVALVITRDRLRIRLREMGAARFPLIAEGTAIVRAYLVAEQARGRIPATADIATLAPTLIGATHLLFTDREGGAPDAEALYKVIATVIPAFEHAIVPVDTHAVGTGRVVGGPD